MRIDLVTLFPEFFTGPLSTGLIGRAIEGGLCEIGYVDPRLYAHDVHRTIDDAPYGGGGGMVMKPDILAQALREAKGRGGGPAVLMSPQGKRVEHGDLLRWARLDHLILVCGRYEGFDERVRRLVDEQISLGDFVMTGGEYAALAIADGVIRLRPGTLGNETSPVTDSFATGLLEHPHYTRPPIFEGLEVPEVLRSGDHAKVEEWRRAESLSRTLLHRPDLFVERGVTEEERSILIALDRPPAPIVLVVGFDRAPEPKAIADLSRLAAAYRLEVRLVGDVAEALAKAPLTEVPLPLPAPEKKKLMKKRRALPAFTVDPRAICRPLSDPSELEGLRVAVAREGAGPWVGPRRLRAMNRPIALLFGRTGLVPEMQLSPFRVGAAGQDLPLLAAAAIALDRLLGEGD